MHIILTGATGLVGGAVLDAMLGIPEITRISILTRRPVPMLEDRIKANDPIASNKERVRVILHKDFNKYDDSLLKGELKGAAGVVWALGISQLVVSKEEYLVITKDYTLAAAEAFKKIPAEDPSKTSTEPFRFVYVSGLGAETKPGLMTQRFGKIKGEVEVKLAEMTNKDPAPGERPFLGSSVRPAGVDPHNHATLAPYVPDVPSISLKLTRVLLAPVLRVTYPSIMSPTAPLGVFLAKQAMGSYSADLVSEATKRANDVEWVGGARFAIVNNTAFRRIMGI
ncbi:hypothetical protein SEUCBS139899_003842 [Sporothrix eucalyptigena]|uniref:Nucleoside-diphosphate-sugar epimerase n=1 Tax=Sporothrix eucalyptigena TaxID=1812306 RepID=A0ABP0BEM7_9PEZI